MIPVLIDLAGLLSRDPLTVEEVVAAVGTATETSEQSVLVRPADAAFTTATVVRRWRTDEPAHVTLRLAAPVPLAVLTDAFGDHTDVAPDDDGPLQALFEVDLEGQPCTVALVASVVIDEVTEVVLRRDIRL